MIHNTISSAVLVDILFVTLFISAIWFFMFFGILYVMDRFIPYGFFIAQFMYMYLYLVFDEILLYSPFTIEFASTPVVWFAASLSLLYIRFNKKSD